MAEEHQQAHDECMNPKRFLMHQTRVYLMRQRLLEAIQRKDSWIFAMTYECGALAMKIGTLHHERTGEHVSMIVPCCLEAHPAFFIFPKEHLHFYEIEQVLGIEVADSKEAAEKYRYFVVAESDPIPLRDLLDQWVRHEHLVN
jgi:hypothetical protein